MKVSVKSTIVLVGLVLVFACSLPLSSSARVGFRNNDAHERVVDAETTIVNATEMAYKHEDENANSTDYGGEALGGGTQLAKGINGGGGSSLQGRCQGGGHSGAQGGCGRGQGGYGGEQGGYGGGKGSYGGGQSGCYCGGQGQAGGYGGGQGGSYRGGSIGQGGRVGGQQGGSSGQGGSEGGYVEPKCGELGCCYAKYGKCLECCKPWWVPPGEMNQVVKEKN